MQVLIMGCGKSTGEYREKLIEVDELDAVETEEAVDELFQECNDVAGIFWGKSAVNGDEDLEDARNGFLDYVRYRERENR